MKKVLKLVNALLVLMFFITFVEARAIYFEEPVVSKGYDFNTNKPIEPTKVFSNKTKEIWVSTWLHEALKDTEVTISWYYYDDKNEKSIIYQESINVSGTKPIVSSLDESKAEYFPTTNYVVEFKINGDTLTSAKFKVIKKAIKPISNTKKECIKPSATDDENIIAKVLSNYSISKEDIKSLELYRQDSLDSQISLILPTSWKRYAQESPIVFNLKNKNQEIIVAKKRIKKELLLKHTPKKIIKMYLSNLVKKNDTVFTKLKVGEFKDYTIAFINVYSKNRAKESANFYNIFLSKNGTLVLVEVIVDKSNLNLGKFLSELSMVSLWTKDIYCPTKVEQKRNAINKKNCKPPTKSSDKELLNSLYKKFPNIKIKENFFTRYNDPYNRFSLLIPATWTRQLDVDKETMLVLSGKKGGYEYQYSIKVTHLDKKDTKNLSPDLIIKAVGELLIDTIGSDIKKSSFKYKIIEPLTIIKDKNRTSGYMILKLIEDSDSVFVGFVLHYDGKNVYVLNLISEDLDIKFIKLLQLLGVKSFWTPSMCKS